MGIDPNPFMMATELDVDDRDANHVDDKEMHVELDPELVCVVETVEASLDRHEEIGVQDTIREPPPPGNPAKSVDELLIQTQSVSSSEKTSDPPVRMIIESLEMENFKSYAGKKTIGPFHKVKKLPFL